MDSGTGGTLGILLIVGLAIWVIAEARSNGRKQAAESERFEMSRLVQQFSQVQDHTTRSFDEFRTDYEAVQYAQVLWSRAGEGAPRVAADAHWMGLKRDFRDKWGIQAP